MNTMAPLPLNDIRLTEGLLSEMQRLVKQQVLPYQWEVLHDRMEDVPQSHCIENFRIAAGLSQGEHYGVVFLDSDLYKWLEAAAYCVAVFGSEAKDIEQKADEACELISKAQGADGYINTYYTVKEPERRFTNLLEGHELYCAGHFFEGAVAYFEATGKRLILDTACRFADYLTKVFGTEEGQLRGYPGHQEVEVGLVRLYRVTGNETYLKLADYFIAQRGKRPSYFEAESKGAKYQDIFHLPVIRQPSYSQCHEEPVRQTVAVGHAVRALYMYSAMADLAGLTRNKGLREACEALYQSVTQRRMYITGAVGSTECGESFTVDYDLPNDTMYGETCASVALMMFSSRMGALTGEGRYFDTVERAFFNQVLGGISQTGREFFYVGPLSVNPAAVKGNPGLSHVKPVRQRWFDVACCPTNIARTTMSIANYAFGVMENTLYIHIPLGCQIRGERFAATLHTEYPFGNTLRMEVEAEQSVALRQPGLAPVKSLRVNGEERPLEAKQGYFHLEGLKIGDVVEATYDLTPRYVVSHPKVTANVGKAAVMRGPLVYCAEQADNGQGIACLVLPPKADFAESEAFAGKGSVALTGQGLRRVFTGGEDLYQERLPNLEPAQVRLIPYCLWANRGEGEMQVYLNLP